MCLENVSVHTTCLSPASLEVSGSGGSLQHGVSLPASKGGSNWSKLGGGGGGHHGSGSCAWVGSENCCSLMFLHYIRITYLKSQSLKISMLQTSYMKTRKLCTALYPLLLRVCFKRNLFLYPYQR